MQEGGVWGGEGGGQGFQNAGTGTACYDSGIEGARNDNKGRTSHNTRTVIQTVIKAPAEGRQSRSTQKISKLQDRTKQLQVCVFTIAQEHLLTFCVSATKHSNVRYSELSGGAASDITQKPAVSRPLMSHCGKAAHHG